MIEINDIFGLLRPSIDVHTLGISVLSKLLIDCDYKVFVGDAHVADALSEIPKINNASYIKEWLQNNCITRIGFSYRLDPQNALRCFCQFYYLLEDNNLLFEQGGFVKSVYFSGLPEAAFLVKQQFGDRIVTFIGDEEPYDTLIKIGVPKERIIEKIKTSSSYDKSRNEFAYKLLSEEKYKYRKPFDRSGYEGYGTRHDHLVQRIHHARFVNELPLIRVHVGPYKSNYYEALKEFNTWLKELAHAKYLDIVSIGSSQLSQSSFGEDWGNKPNGGGVPINSELDLFAIWEAARPMLVRTYAGTKNIPRLARIYEKTINIAWHALSFWWFCEIDGRGGHTVKYNLEEHIDTLKYIAQTGKPFEPNIPHHFSFRGGDDFTYVLSGYLAAKTAKKHNIRYFILQTMLNTPKYISGVKDLAKARALLQLVKSLECDTFKVFLQPRAGLDYFSPNIEKAKMQLASVTAMMDDIDPLNQYSPDIIHVVSYSEAIHLATPDIINDSIKITFQAIEDYRIHRARGSVENMAYNIEVHERTNELLNEMRIVENLIEKYYKEPYSSKGLYDIFCDGLLPVPYLWEGREEFTNAVKWNTSIVDGSVQVVDSNGDIISPSVRISKILDCYN